MVFRACSLWLVIVSLALGGCNFKRPRPLAKEKPAPGLFSGKSGEITIYSSKKRKRQ
jgi:hypothetical protein